MSKNQFVDFKAIKQQIRMEQILERYGLMDQFKRGNDSLSGPCPIHKGNNPTQFRVSISKNVWNCFSECKHGGNALDFISRMENVSIHAAALKAIEWFDLGDIAMSDKTEDGGHNPDEAAEVRPDPKPRPKKPIQAQEKIVPNKPLKFRLDKLEREHPYLIERGLTLETIVDFGTGFCTKGTMENRIAIPIHNMSGDVVAYAGRFPGEPDDETPKYKLPQGFRKSLELFNIDRAVKEPPEQPLVIVEGFFDCMKMHQHGCRKVVALMGSTMSAAQEEIIKQLLTPTSLVIVMLDEDEAGQAGREDVASRLCLFAFVRIHTFQSEGMQPENLSPEEISTFTE